MRVAWKIVTTSALVVVASGCRGEAAGDGLPVRPVDASDHLDAGVDGAVTTPDSGIDPDMTDSGSSALSVWATMPVMGQGRYRLFTGYDRNEASSYPLIDPGNKDFNNFLAVCGVSLPVALQEVDNSASCDPALKGYVVVSDDNGPGIVSRSLFAVGTVEPLTGADVTFEDERIRIYVDDLSAPVYDGRLSDWRSGTAPPFIPPLTTWTSGSLVSYVPMRYQSKLRILLDNLSLTSAYYHRVEILSNADAASVIPAELLAGDVTRTMDRLRAEARSVEGKTTYTNQPFTLEANGAAHVLDATGAGTIEMIRMTVDTADVADLRAISVSFRWDHQPAPAIDLSLAQLFGAHQALANFDTLPMTVRVDGAQTELTLSLPMPFASHAGITLTNRGTRVYVVKTEVVGTPAVPIGDWGHLHAVWREQTDSFVKGERYAVADLTGRGKYIGTMMFLQGRSDPDSAIPSPFNFLEGDDRTIVDGVTSKGTGTEDVFDGGWYFIDGRYDRPFAALIAKVSNGDTGAVSAVRWNVLANAIPFQSSFRLDFEYGANQPNTAIAYASVGFYYQR